MEKTTTRAQGDRLKSPLYIFYLPIFKTMETLNRQNAETFAQFNALLGGISEGELINYVLNLSKGWNLGYTEELAKQFLENLKEKENSELEKGEFRTFKGYYLISLLWNAARRADEMNKKELEYWKNRINWDFEKKSEEWRDLKQKEIFKDAFLEYYKDQNEEKLRKRINLGYYRPNDACKTKNKIDNKLKTKSHNLEKIVDLINEEINTYWRHSFALLNDEEKSEYWKIRRGAWFTQN